MNGLRLRQARELRRWKQAALAERLNVSQSTIARLETGSLEPSEDLLERISVVTGFPRRYFREFDPVQIPEGSFVKFRSRRSKLRPNDRSYVLQLAQVGVTLYEHMAREFKRFPDLLPQGLEGDPEEAALAIRKALGAGANAPIPRLLHMAERAGVVCIAIPASELQDFDGASFRINGRPAIVLNAERDAEAVRMTVAHELGHLCWVPAQSGAIAEMEASAYDVGGRVLFPTEAANEEMPHPVTLAALSQVKARWGMEVKALAVRAQRLGLLSDDRYRSLMIGHRKVWPEGEQASGRFTEKPRALSKMVEELCGGDTKRLANLVGIPQGLIDEIVQAHARRRDAPRRSKSGQVLSFPVLERIDVDEAERA